MADFGVSVRKTVAYVEDIFHEGGPEADRPLRRGAIAAVIRNPFAGRYVEDIAGYMEDLKPLGLSLAKNLLDVIGRDVSEIESYGKGAIVGGEGELEHGALWHVPGGYAMRELLGWKSPAEGPDGQPDNALAIVPSTKKIGAIGTSLDVPLTHINASYVRSHFDSIEVRVPDAPRGNEIVLVLAMSTGARVHARVGGLAAGEISRWDGLR
jgi:Amino acid synthesis